MKFNEDSRVKIPVILHLTKLGYEYMSLKNNSWATSTNIFTNIFKSSIGILEYDKFKSAYIYPYLVNELPRLMSLRTGAQQPHINKGILDESFVIVPPVIILENYFEGVMPNYDMILNRTFENK